MEREEKKSKMMDVYNLDDSLDVKLMESGNLRRKNRLVCFSGVGRIKR